MHSRSKLKLKADASKYHICSGKCLKNNNQRADPDQITTLKTTKSIPRREWRKRYKGRSSWGLANFSIPHHYWTLLGFLNEVFQHRQNGGRGVAGLELGGNAGKRVGEKLVVCEFLVGFQRSI